jgi:hypothetical protein
MSDLGTFQKLLGRSKPVIVGWFPRDGWLLVSETWTYASPTTIEATGDYSGTYQVGDCWKHTQSGSVRYYYITGVSYSSSTGKTTITLNGGTDYSVANATISETYYSHGGRPMGFPEWFTGSFSGSVGWSTTPTGYYRFKMEGKTVHLNFAAGGTSNSPLISIPLPIEASSSVSSGSALFYAANNGTPISTACRAIVRSSAPTIISCYPNMYSGSWTTTGTKQVYFTGSYEAK